MIDIQDIQKNFRGHVTLNEALSKHTSFRIGGPADYYLEPADKDDAVRLAIYLHGQRIPFMVMGNGSNLLVSGGGVRGVVINLEYGLKNVRMLGEIVIADAGVSLAKFVDFCIQQSRQGVEMLAGIPGTIGGAVVMNAGAYGGEISDHIVEVEVLHESRINKVKKAEAGFAYRRSGLNTDIILGASFALPLGNKAELMSRRRQLLIKRNESQPLNLPNSGSVFKNPPGTFAGKLIEEAGLKGTRRGKAQISEQHGNFIVNTGGATAADVLELIQLAQTTVQEKFNIRLELEVKVVGFPVEIYKELFR